MNFRSRVLEVVKAIPPGSVLTYGEVAKLAGYPGAARAVGQAMKKNTCSFITHPDSREAIPCHRVVGANLRLGGFNAGQSKKAQLLKSEGWTIKTGILER